MYEIAHCELIDYYRPHTTMYLDYRHTNNQFIINFTINTLVTGICIEINRYFHKYFHILNVLHKLFYHLAVPESTI